MSDPDILTLSVKLHYNMKSAHHQGFQNRAISKRLRKRSVLLFMGFLRAAPSQTGNGSHAAP